MNTAVDITGYSPNEYPHEHGKAPARQRRGLESAPQEPAEKGINIMTQTTDTATKMAIPQPRVSAETATTTLQAGDRYRMFDDNGYQRGAGVVVSILPENKLCVTRDGMEGRWTIGAEMCIHDVEPVPLDPAITGPFDVADGWSSTTELALREHAGFFPKDSRDRRILLELAHEQMESDHAAMAGLVGITPCPAWCADAGSHSWEMYEPGTSYYRCHRLNSPVFDTGMELMQSEEMTDTGSTFEKAVVWIDGPALDVDDHSISVDLIPGFIAELTRLSGVVTRQAVTNE